MNKKICLLACMVMTTVLLIPSLAAAYGNITVSSVPSGATVLVDSIGTGATTPTTIEGVSSGTHYILLRLTGYQDYTRSIVVSNDTTSTISGTLIPIATTTTAQITNGSIRVESNPSNAAVFLNTEYQGKTPLTLYNITHGTYRVLVQKIDYQDWSERISVTSGARTDVYATLQAEATDTTIMTTIATATTVRTTIAKTSTAKVPTPWPGGSPTPASPLSALAILGAVGLGFVVFRK
jgi:hypothetical protein